MSINIVPDVKARIEERIGAGYRLQQTREGISSWLEENIPFLDNPEIYATRGDEMNTVHRNWEEADFRLLLAGGMPYRSSVGNLAIPLIYSEIADETDDKFYFDRAYFWESRADFEKMTKGGLPIFGLESRQPIFNFDVVGFSLSYLQTILHPQIMMKWSGIPHKAKDRTADDPLIIFGGHHCYVNTEVAWEIPDFVYIGEFSAGALDIYEKYREAKKLGQPKWEFIKELAMDHTPGVYVPSFYREEYSSYHPYPIKRVVPLLEGLPYPVEKAYVHNLDLDAHINTKPIVPFMNAGMGTAEIMSSEGCPAAVCTFCSEGQTNKPYRFFSVDKIVEAAKEQMKYSGMKSFTLSAFDGAGHPQKKRLIMELLEQVSDDVALLSLRVDEMADDPEFASLSTSSGNKTLSLGVEGMSERMRAVYQKHCTTDDLLEVVERAIAAGAQKVKFFMIANHPGSLWFHKAYLVTCSPPVLSLNHRDTRQAGAKTTGSSLHLGCEPSPLKSLRETRCTWLLLPEPT